MLETAIDWRLLGVFIPTFTLTSLSPGMCMSLALTLGIAVGVKRSLWMMAGELTGVALVSLAAVLGVASIALAYPAAFAAFKLLGGAYLMVLGIGLWRRRPQAGIEKPEQLAFTPGRLALQGFVTAAANPKGWAFSIALLPPFVDPARALGPQLIVLIGIILLIEFASLMIYAHGGQQLSRWLRQGHHRQHLDRITGSLLMAVGLWLMID